MCWKRSSRSYCAMQNTSTFQEIMRNGMRKFHSFITLFMWLHLFRRTYYTLILNITLKYTVLLCLCFDCATNSQITFFLICSLLLYRNLWRGNGSSSETFTFLRNDYSSTSGSYVKQVLRPTLIWLPNVRAKRPRICPHFLQKWNIYN